MEKRLQRSGTCPSPPLSSLGPFPRESHEPPRVNNTLTDAARVSLERRLNAGGARTGWSQAWTSACFARLLDGDAALEHVQALLTAHAMDNMFHAIGRGSVFQIDSNFGAVAAVAEMLLQSHADMVHLLPALPSSLGTGSVSGLVARGGFEVSVSWENGSLAEAKVESRLGGRLEVRVADGLSFRIDSQEVESVNTRVGQTYVITLA